MFDYGAIRPMVPADAAACLTEVDVKLVRALFTGLVAGWFLTGNALAQDAHVAFLKNVTGKVSVMRDQTQLLATPGMQLMKRDTVLSGPASSAGVVFVDGTSIAMGAFSELEISRYVFRPEDNQYDFAVALKKGRAVYASGRLAKMSPGSVEVSTPRATVGVRGTRFIIDSDE